MLRAPKDPGSWGRNVGQNCQFTWNLIRSFLRLTTKIQTTPCPSTWKRYDGLPVCGCPVEPRWGAQDPREPNCDGECVPVSPNCFSSLCAAPPCVPPPHLGLPAGGEDRVPAAPAPQFLRLPGLHRQRARPHPLQSMRQLLLRPTPPAGQLPLPHLPPQTGRSMEDKFFLKLRTVS